MMWPPPLPLDEIIRVLGGEPWCFTKDYAESLSRDEVFAYHITKEVLKRGKKKKKRRERTHREAFFTHGKNIGHSWLRTEAEWQAFNRCSRK